MAWLPANNGRWLRLRAGDASFAQAPVHDFLTLRQKSLMFEQRLMKNMDQLEQLGQLAAGKAE